MPVEAGPGKVDGASVQVVREHPQTLDDLHAVRGEHRIAVRVDTATMLVDARVEARRILR
jgi:hypothetical protein